MNVTVTWKDPQTRADGSPLAASEIARIDVLMAVGGTPDFVKLAEVAPGVQTFTQTDLPAGNFDFKLVVVDNQREPQSSVGAVVSVTVVEPLKAAPSDVTDLAAVVSG